MMQFYFVCDLDGNELSEAFDEVGDAKFWAIETNMDVVVKSNFDNYSWSVREYEYSPFYQD